MSLGDIVRAINGGALVRAGINFRAYQIIMRIVENFPQGLDLAGISRLSTEKADQDTMERLVNHLNTAKDNAEGLGLNATQAKISRVLNDYEKETPTLPHIGRDCDDILERMKDELDVQLFLIVDTTRTRFYKRPLDGWESVVDQFPSASFDIEEAGKCLSLDRGTASIMHLMRVLETGLYALADDLLIPKVEPNWHNAIQQIEKAIRGLDKNDSRTQTYSAAAAHLFNVKDAWRNSVAHAGQAYPVDKAEQIYENVRAFMQTLVTHLGEKS